MYDLNFSLLPVIHQHRIFKGLAHFVDEPLNRLQLPETVDRLRAASLFLADVSASEKAWLNRAYLRASLSEFRSVTHALYWDLGHRDVHSPSKSTNPLVHLVFRLRRLAVYVASVETAESEVRATFRMRDKEHTTDIKILLIEEIEQYLRNENLKHYRDEDISRICEWFDANQRVYGASQVLDVGVMVYCQELVEVYADRLTPA